MNGIYGAILGDILGSLHESILLRKMVIRESDLFHDKLKFTDDTVLTIAVAEKLFNENENYSKFYMRWGELYPDCGYGYGFYEWLSGKNIDSVRESFGNGCLMRCSPISYISNDLNIILKESDFSIFPTHVNNISSICVKLLNELIYDLINKASKNSIKIKFEKCFKNNFKIDNALNFDLEELHTNYEGDATCLGSFPQAVFCFLESTSYLNCITKCIYIGGDTDTICNIAGSLAGEFYGMNVEHIKFVNTFIPEPMRLTLKNFSRKFVK